MTTVRVGRTLKHACEVHDAPILDFPTGGKRLKPESVEYRAVMNDGREVTVSGPILKADGTPGKIVGQIRYLTIYGKWLETPPQWILDWADQVA